MYIHVINKTNKIWEVVCVDKFRQLFSKHRVREIVSSVGWRAVQTRKMFCYAVAIVAWTTSFKV